MTPRLIESKQTYLKIFHWFINNVDSFDFTKAYFFELEDADKRRSKLQNSYLFGWVYPQLANALEDCGAGEKFGIVYTPAIIHAIAQANWRVIGEGKDANGKDFFIFRSTADMGKKEFSEDVKKIDRYFIDLHSVGIPDHRESVHFSKVANEIGV